MSWFYQAVPVAPVILESTPPAGVVCKVWDGASFVAKPVKVWDGAAFVTKTTKVWNGSAFV